MHGNVWACDEQKQIALWAKTQSKLLHSHDIISHTNLECIKHCYNDREYIAWSYDNKITKPNPKFWQKHKNLKNFPKTWKPRSKCMKCMNYEKMRGFRSHTKGLNLKWIEILMGRRILVKRKSLGRERREKDRDIWVKSKPSWPSCIYKTGVSIDW